MTPMSASDGEYKHDEGCSKSWLATYPTYLSHFLTPSVECLLSLVCHREISPFSGSRVMKLGL
jgi:hypothetical protein